MGGIVGAVAGPVIGAITGGGGGGSQVAQGAANIAGGMLSAQEAQQLGNQLAGIANPFGQYNAQFGKTLADAATAGTYGNASPQSVTAMGNYVNSNTMPLTGALNGVSFGQQLNNLVANPSSVFSSPLYQASFQQGQNAVNATLAAQGLNASGNQLAALQNYGQSFGANYYSTMLSQLSGLYGQALGANNQGFGQLASSASADLAANNQAFGQLALLSGASSGSPAAAAQAVSNVYGNVNSAYGSVGQGVGQVANGIGNLLNGLSGSTGGFNFDTGLGTTTGGFGDVSGSGALFGPSAGFGGDGYTYGGSNSWGFTS
ncbi:hypothetical protein CFB47_07855 [Burkholderia sp. AU27893]|uniref:Uncharacterized protein n=2 Tax=Burkholderiaceae TaxID=119060 RepID=A0A2S5DRM1_9BURK|nr:hypothetical protein CFB47_07855 [Burkholderia sp. AU27893]POZ81758.1 hypothetical protein C3743_15710 [Burkholderia contaminans]